MHRSLVSSLVLLGASCAVSSPIKAQTLTDISLFRLDSSGNTNAEGWNTRGNDTISNVYLISGGNFVNSGNSASASIAIDLSVPGTYVFSFVGNNVNTNTATQIGMNFFFNNDALTPGISVRGTGPGSFVANGGVTNTPLFATVAGANTLTFGGSQQVTLTDFTYQTNSGIDQVTSFNNVPGDTGDTIGSFTLIVGSVGVPEAPALPLLLLGSLTGIAVVFRRPGSVA
jgi:hypothetical protein